MSAPLPPRRLQALDPLAVSDSRPLLLTKLPPLPQPIPQAAHGYRSLHRPLALPASAPRQAWGSVAHPLPKSLHSKPSAKQVVEQQRLHYPLVLKLTMSKVDAVAHVAADAERQGYRVEPSKATPSSYAPTLPKYIELRKELPNPVDHPPPTAGTVSGVLISLLVETLSGLLP
jgi:hypothetical protein